METFSGLLDSLETKSLREKRVKRIKIRMIVYLFTNYSFPFPPSFLDPLGISFIGGDCVVITQPPLVVVASLLPGIPDFIDQRLGIWMLAIQEPGKVVHLVAKIVVKSGEFVGEHVALAFR